MKIRFDVIASHLFAYINYITYIYDDYITDGERNNQMPILIIEW